MAAIASAPIPVTTYDEIQYRRPQSRSFARPAVRRAYVNKASPQPHKTPNLTTDSSDDEDLAPIKLSAEAQAILGEDNSQGGSPGHHVHNEDVVSSSRGGEAPGDGGGRVHAVRQSSTSPGRSDGSPAPRIVRVASTARPTALTSLARDGSFMYKTVGKVEDRPYRVVSDARTPASRLKKVRVSGSRSASHSPPSTQSDVKSNDTLPRSTEREDPHHAVPKSPEEDEPRDEHVPVGPSTIMRPRRIDENHPHSTARSAKRFGAGFKTSHIRSGMIRR